MAGKSVGIFYPYPVLHLKYPVNKQLQVVLASRKNRNHNTHQVKPVKMEEVTPAPPIPIAIEDRGFGARRRKSGNVAP
jgi:hypothetical protein